MDIKDFYVVSQNNCEVQSKLTFKLLNITYICPNNF